MKWMLMVLFRDRPTKMNESPLIISLLFRSHPVKKTHHIESGFFWYFRAQCKEHKEIFTKGVKMLGRTEHVAAVMLMEVQHNSTIPRDKVCCVFRLSSQTMAQQFHGVAQVLIRAGNRVPPPPASLLSWETRICPSLCTAGWAFRLFAHERPLGLTHQVERMLSLDRVSETGESFSFFHPAIFEWTVCVIF